MLDASAGLLAEDSELLEHARQRGTTTVVWKKTDLLSAEAAGLPESGGDESSRWWPVSAATGYGIGELRRAIIRAALPGLDGARESCFPTNIRHEWLIEQALEALAAARIGVQRGVPHEMPHLYPSHDRKPDFSGGLLTAGERSVRGIVPYQYRRSLEADGTGCILEKRRAEPRAPTQVPEGRGAAPKGLANK